MNRLILFIIFIIFNVLVYSQNPYVLSWKTDGIMTGSSIALSGINYALNKKLKPLTIEEIENLNLNNINSFDRWASNQHSASANTRSDWEVYGIAALAMASPLIISDNTTRKQYIIDVATLGIIWFETNLVTFIATDLVRTNAKRTRPYAYTHHVPIHDKFDVDVRKSFFSRHTSLSAANSFFLAKVFSDYYPNSKWKPLVWGASLTIPAITGFERILAGQHFPTDVISGYLFGATCGYLIPHFHKNNNNTQSFNIQTIPFYNSYSQGVYIAINIY